MGPKGSGLKKRRVKDPNRPKRPTSAYFYFAAFCREQLAKEGKSITRVGDFTKGVSLKWKALTDMEKVPYEASAQKDRQRYEREMTVYNGKKPVSTKPKRAATAYFHFLADFRKRPEVARLHIKEISKKAGEAWGLLTEAQKRPYLEMYEKEKAAIAAGLPSPYRKPPPEAPVIEEEEEESDEEDDDE